jgi:eukaryotic-like serine/threonine-protein kinase
MSDLVGQHWGNYQLVHLLGRGGFAEVYLGEHVRLKTQAAIKILQTHLSDEGAEAFLHEAQVIAQLKHPHIVRVLDFNLQEQRPFLVLEYAPNGSLRDRHRPGVHVPLPQVVDYIKQVAGALHYAHEKRLIHRDVKPANMLLGRHNQVLLTDFGIVTTAHSTSSMTTQNTLGTLAYMAPEQIRAYSRPASDQYALAVVAYAWLCGELPFQGTAQEIIVAHLSRLPRLPREHVPELPLEVERVIMIALAKDPKERFTSVLDFANALEQASQGIMPHVTRPTSPEDATDEATVVAPYAAVTEHDPQAPAPHSPSDREPSGAPTPPQSGQMVVPVSVQKKPTRRRVLVGALVAGALTVGAGATWASLAHSSGQTSAPPPITPTPTPGPTYLVEACGKLAWSSDGKYLLLANSSRVTIRQATGDYQPLLTYSEEKGYDNQPAGARSLAWSPDNKRVVSAYSKARVWDANTGQTVYVFDSHTVDMVDWSDDGKYIVATSTYSSDLFVLDASNGTALHTHKIPDDGRIQNLAWAPDSQRIACGMGDGGVLIWDVLTGEHLFTYTGHQKTPISASSGGRWIGAVAWSPDGKRVASIAPDKTLQIWDAADGAHAVVYYPRPDDIAFEKLYALAWSPNGKYIAVGGELPNYEGAFQIWEFAGGKVVYSMVSVSSDDYDHRNQHFDNVSDAAWSPDSKYLALGMSGGSFGVCIVTPGLS